MRRHPHDSYASAARPISISYGLIAHIHNVQFRANGAFIMLDLVFVASGLGFFILAAGYAAGCELL